MTEQHEEELFDSEPFPEADKATETVAEKPEEQNKPEADTKPEPVEKPKADLPTEGNVTVTPDKPEPGFVPFAAVLDERDKRRALEQELQQIREQAQAKDQPPPPDFWEDPDGWQAHQAQQFQAALYQQRLEMSQKFAVQQYGEEAVAAALEWGRQKCETDRPFNDTVFSHSDPVGYAVQQYQREQIASQVDASEFEQFKAWKAAQSAVAQPNNPTPQEPPPSRSIATAPSAGGQQQIAVGQEALFDEEFR